MTLGATGAVGRAGTGARQEARCDQRTIPGGPATGATDAEFFVELMPTVDAGEE